MTKTWLLGGRRGSITLTWDTTRQWLAIQLDLGLFPVSTAALLLGPVGLGLLWRWTQPQ